MAKPLRMTKSIFSVLMSSWWYLFFIGEFSLIYQCSSSTTNYDGWTSPLSPTLPRPCRGAAVGYDNLTKSVWLVGGGGSWGQLVSFNANSREFQDHGANYFSNHIHGVGKFYVQIDHRLWMVPYDDDVLSGRIPPYLIVFDVITTSMQYNYSGIVIPVKALYACLATTTDTNGVSYLMVVGGTSYYGRTAHDIVQILNLETNIWLQNVPLMKENRRYLTCEVANDYLYAIGGEGMEWKQLNSIEILYVGDLKNIHYAAWTYIDSLAVPVIGPTSVVYQNDIIVIGGFYIDTNIFVVAYNAEINVIDTNNNTVTSGGHLAYAAYSISAVLIYPVIYGFGGYNDYMHAMGLLDHWQYVFLHPTLEPTLSPTMDPTVYPTIGPTSTPTSVTISPTSMEGILKCNNLVSSSTTHAYDINYYQLIVNVSY
eukprot:264472_1